MTWAPEYECYCNSSYVSRGVIHLLTDVTSAAKFVAAPLSVAYLVVIFYPFYCFIHFIQVYADFIPS